MSQRSAAEAGAQPEAGAQSAAVTPLDVIRLIVLLAAMASLALWGFGSWALPWNIVVGIGAPLAVLLVWAAFLSPRSMLRLHPFLRAIVEVLLYVGVTMAWWSMNSVWIGIAFALVAVASGVIAGRRALS